MASERIFGTWEEGFERFGLVNLYQPEVAVDDFWEALRRMGLARHHINVAYEYIQHNGLEPADAIRELGLDTGDLATRALALQHELPYGNPAVASEVDPETVQAFVRENFATQVTYVPVARCGDTVLFLVADPAAASNARRFMYAQAQDHRAEVALASPSIIEDIFHAQMLDTAGEFDRVMAGSTGQERAQSMLNALLVHSCYQRASDIHIEPKPSGGLVKLRIDGQLRVFRVLSHEDTERMVNVVFTRIRAQDVQVSAEGSLDHDEVPEILGHRFNFRVELTNTVDGRAVVIRILDRGMAEATDLDTLGFMEDDLAKLRRYAESGAGLVIATGPTSSGKSTTLHALAEKIDPIERSVQTVENPVEYKAALWKQHETRRQQQDQSEAEEWNKWFRALLRSDPDVILLGEVRDVETASVMVEAANTGHLVLTTLHTQTAALAITRLRSMQGPGGQTVDMDALSAILLGVVAQRLVRRLCECAVPDDRPETREALEDLGHDATFARRPSDEGCPKCGGTGYRGRRLIYELLHVNQDVRRSIAEGARSVDLEAHIDKSRTLWGQGIRLVSSGETSLAEIKQAAREE